MNEEESDKTTLKTENRNRNEENRRQIIDFIADNEISDSKTVSKAIVAYCHLQRHIRQIEGGSQNLNRVKVRPIWANGWTNFGQTGERMDKKSKRV